MMKLQTRRSHTNKRLEFQSPGRGKERGQAFRPPVLSLDLSNTATGDGLSGIKVIID